MPEHEMNMDYKRGIAANRCECGEMKPSVWRCCKHCNLAADYIEQEEILRSALKCLDTLHREVGGTLSILKKQKNAIELRQLVRLDVASGKQRTEEEISSG